MTTTLEKYQPGSQSPNYSTYPKVDVEIIDEPRLCKEDGAVVVYEREGGPYSMGRWVHADGDPKPHPFVQPLLRCDYCGTQDPELVVYRQHAWYDAIECSRCEGVWGRPIGD